MSLISFIVTGNTTLATDKLVYSAEELGALETVIEKVRSVDRVIGSESACVSAAEERGYEAGYERGRQDGVQAAIEATAERLSSLTLRANRERDELQASAATLAFSIVERIAQIVGPVATIAALARRAAAELAPRRPVVLHVATQVVQPLREHLERHNDTDQEIQVEADESLETTDCILETEFGRINADLNTQLRVLGERLGES